MTIHPSNRHILQEVDNGSSHLHLISPGKLIRNLSHSKIIHFPSLCEKSETEKAESIDLIPKHHHSSVSYKAVDDLPMSAVIKIQNDPTHQQQPQQPKTKRPLGLKRLPFGRYLGLVLALLSSLTISCVTLIVKSMNDYNAFTLVIWRLQGILFPSIAMVLFMRLVKKEKIFDSFMPIMSPGKGLIGLFLVLRGIFGCSADIFQYYSLKYLSLADSSVISYSTPIFVTFVAHFFLNEKCGIVSVLVSFASLIGVLVITRPPFLTGEDEYDSGALMGNFLALGCMAMGTLTFIILRTLRKVHFTLTTFSFGFIGTIQSFVLCYFISTFEVPQKIEDWGWALLIAVLYFLGQLFFTLALQLEEAGPVSLVRSCDVIFAYLWQFLFLNVVPDSYSLIGGSIVITGVLITAVRKWLNELPEDDRRRKKFWILLK